MKPDILINVRDGFISIALAGPQSFTTCVVVLADPNPRSFSTSRLIIKSSFYVSYVRNLSLIKAKGISH